MKKLFLYSFVFIVNLMSLTSCDTASVAVAADIPAEVVYYDTNNNLTVVYINGIANYRYWDDMYCRYYYRPVPHHRYRYIHRYYGPHHRPHHHATPGHRPHHNVNPGRPEGHRPNHNMNHNNRPNNRPNGNHQNNIRPNNRPSNFGGGHYHGPVMRSSTMHHNSPRTGGGMSHGSYGGGHRYGGRR